MIDPSVSKFFSLAALVLTAIGTMLMTFQAFSNEDDFKKSIRFYIEFMPKADSVPDSKRNEQTFPIEYRRAEWPLNIISIMLMTIFLIFPAFVINSIESVKNNNIVVFLSCLLAFSWFFIL